MFRIVDEILDTAKYLDLARSNMVAAWPKSHYRRELIQLKFFHKRMFVMNRPKDIKHVMVANAANYRKSLANRQSLKPLLGKGVFVREGKLWEWQRKIMSPATQKKRLAGYAETMMEAGLEVADAWESNLLDGEVDVMEEMTLLTSDIITRAIIGVVLGDRNTTLYQSFQDYLASHGRIHISELIGLPSCIPRPGQARGRAAARQFDELIASVIEERDSQKEQKDDLLQTLVDLREESRESMTGQLLRDEVASIYLAGHETTAITLTWAFHLLQGHPDIRERLWAELEDTLLLALFAQRFDLKLRLGHPVEPLGRMTLRPHLGMPMQVHQLVR